MIVSKDDFKQLKKDAGGIRGSECIITVTYVSGIPELKANSLGNLELMKTGIFFDVALGQKVFVPIDGISNAVANGNVIEIGLEDEESQYILLFKGKEIEINKFYNTLMGKLGLLRAESYRPETKEDGPLRCPKCSSTQLTSHKKGFSVVRGVLGASVSLGVGAIAGAIGKNKVEIVCLKCGHKFMAGK